MTTPTEHPRLQSGVRNLDDIFGGGVPAGSLMVVGGPPGAGKTILAQQFCFHNASPERRVLYFSTLSEPTAKTLRYLHPFAFFDAQKVEQAIRFVDLGVILRSKGLAETSALIMEQVRQYKPAIVVIDSFKVFDDLAKSDEELRKFGYELAVHLMAWEATTFLLGEYGPRDIETNPLFSIVDGLLVVTQREQSGEQQRVLQLVKMRGTQHSRDEHTFLISRHGLEVFAPRLTLQRESTADVVPTPRMQTGIAKLDELLGEGIPHGSSLLVGGVAGTGKTVLLLEFVYRGALRGEKGILFSFEETPERLHATARGLGWDLGAQVAAGRVEIVFIPQPNVLVESHLLMMKDRIEALGARRVAVDSVSVFLHKVTSAHVARDKVFQLASIVQNTSAVGLFATDIPYGTQQISRFGVEETVVDGIVLLTATEEGYERQRYLEVYKLRNTAHLRGRHHMTIGHGGITLYPRYEVEAEELAGPASVATGRRLPSGVPGLDALMGGGLLERSVTLVSGSAGVGKSTIGLQFVTEGAARGEHGLFVSLEEGPAQLQASAEALGIPLAGAVAKGLVELVFLSRRHVRANQFLTILADRIREGKVRRLVLDSVSQIVAEGLESDELQRLLAGLVARFKALGVTTLLTVEAKAMTSAETISDHGFSPLADNLLVLRYEADPGELRPYLTVVKTRGSAHDRGAWYCDVREGGVRVGPRRGTSARRPASRPGRPPPAPTKPRPTPGKRRR